jgi:hypothetical protein
VPRTKKDFITARLGVFTPPGFRLALVVPFCYRGIRVQSIREGAVNHDESEAITLTLNELYEKV